MGLPAQVAMTFHSRSFAGRVGADPSLNFLSEVARRTPMLAREEEFRLARLWRDNQDQDARDRLVKAHMRLVLKRASGYGGYGLPLADLASEGHVGLLKAIDDFDPERGFRLSTYAGWWIDAMLKGYVITNWNLVKLGTTADQKRLFFGLRRAKARLGAYAGGGLSPEEASQIAKDFGVATRDVVEMDQRLMGDASLNVRLGLEDDGAEWMDMLGDDSPGADVVLAASDEAGKRKAVLHDALTSLKDRELDIFRWRRLAEEPRTLEELAGTYGVSRERIRQIEVKALEKVTREATRIARDRGLVEPLALSA